MTKLRGHVVVQPFGGESKSRHDAVMLLTGNERYVLRRRDGNPFHDDVLDTLVGKEIVADGVIVDYTLIMSDWEVVGE